jgi:hypothetical protein
VDEHLPDALFLELPQLLFDPFEIHFVVPHPQRRGSKLGGWVLEVLANFFRRSGASFLQSLGLQQELPFVFDPVRGAYRLRSRPKTWNQTNSE